MDVESPKEKPNLGTKKTSMLLLRPPELEQEN